MSKWSGSDFVGPTENSWPQGVGKFKFPNGVVYEGQFDKGEFHGDGTLHYPNGVSTCNYDGLINASLRLDSSTSFSKGETTLHQSNSFCLTDASLSIFRDDTLPSGIAESLSLVATSSTTTCHLRTRIGRTQRRRTVAFTLRYSRASALMARRSL